MYRTCLTHLIVLVKWLLTRKKSGEVTRSIPKKNPLGRTFSSAAKIKQLFLELDKSQVFKCKNLNLAGGMPTPLKNMKVSLDYYSKYMGKLKKPPNHQPGMISDILGLS